MPRWVRKVVEAEETVEHFIEEEVSQIHGRAYKVYDNRAALVAQVNSIEEAEAEVARFPGGNYKMV